MPPRKELRDFRSLERRSMYSIFHALDPKERLPRELIREGHRYRPLEWPHLLWIVALGYLPLLLLTFVVLGWLNVNPTLVFAIAGAELLGVYVFALAARRP